MPIFACLERSWERCEQRCVAPCRLEEDAFLLQLNSNADMPCIDALDDLCWVELHVGVLHDRDGPDCDFYG